MLELLRHSTRNVVAALLAGLLLRLWFIHYYPVIDGDTLVYGEIARNWFWHGIYGFTRADGIHPTLIRLPGYPLFLGICFFLFGVDHYTPILFLQAAIDLCSCLLAAAFAARMVSRKAGVATLYLAALCPFTANFVAAPLTETPTIFCIALGLYALARYLERPQSTDFGWLVLGPGLQHQLRRACCVRTERCWASCLCLRCSGMDECISQRDRAQGWPAPARCLR